MRKNLMKLVVLSVILLVSMSGIVLGALNNTTGAIGNNTNTTKVNITGASTGTTTVNVTKTPIVTAISTPVNVTKTPTVTAISTPVNQITITPSKTSVPEKAVETYPPSKTSTPVNPAGIPKSPGLGFVISVIVLISAVYMTRRR